MMLAPDNPHGKRLRKRYGKVRNSLFTFLEHPEAPPDNNGSERKAVQRYGTARTSSRLSMPARAAR
jgi:hypothetical protein